VATPPLWIVNSEALVAQRWERLLSEEGVGACKPSDLAAFLAGSKGETGLALIDIACLAAPRDKTLASAKAQSGGFSFILTSGPELSNDEIISMLEAGADDYFSHSLHPNLFTAKVKAHLRRALPKTPQNQSVLKAPGGDLKLDRAKRELWARGAEGRWEKRNDLTPTEFLLLALFLERPGVAFDREALMGAMKPGEPDSIWPGTVDKHIESLRRKLGKRGARIKAIYGVGYAYREKG